MDRISLSDRMRQYEEVYNYTITPRLPIIGRADGRSFHNLTKKIGYSKPFDYGMLEIMVESTRFLCEQVQGCTISYIQSDEISFVIQNTQSLDAQTWFSNRIQKIASVASSAISAVFNRYLKPYDPFAMFDCRIFCMPNIVEVYNYLVSRQQDCMKNSISSVAYYEISRSINEESGKPYGKKTANRMLYGLDSNQRQELLFQTTGLNWSDYDPKFKRGVVLFKDRVEIETDNGIAIRTPWVDIPAPHFTSDDGVKFIFEQIGDKDVNISSGE